MKCVVWDLDETLWEGVLLEGDATMPRPEALRAIEELDRRGILQSIASKNEEGAALDRLERLGLRDYFLAPQIGWGSKAESIARIAESLNLATDSFAFVDDQRFELEEVAFSHPEVLCIDAAEIGSMLERPELRPRFVTSDSRSRRLLYMRDLERGRAEQQFEGPKEAFLATLDMRFSIRAARPGDLERAEELTERTHQLNSTGYTYGYGELAGFCASPDHELLVAELEDRYGSYGTIGVALLETGQEPWVLKLLLMSCRVMSRGVGGVFLRNIARMAEAAGAGLRAEFVPTDRNRMMYVTYRFSGFEELSRRGDRVLLERRGSRSVQDPPYVQVRVAA